MPHLPEGDISQKPEDQELNRKRAELARWEKELAERELELSTLRAVLSAFEKTYLDLVGRRYAELDHLEAQIAELVARLSPEDPSAKDHAEAARSKCRESVAEVSGAEAMPASGRFAPSERLKTLYREAAKALHPDLTIDGNEKMRRQDLMKQVNQAYEHGDERLLVSILREWQASPEAVKGEGAGAELVRIIRKIAQVQTRLDMIQAELSTLSQTELFQLYSKAGATTNGEGDVLHQMTARIEVQISEARHRLNELQQEVRSP